MIYTTRATQFLGSDLQAFADKTLKQAEAWGTADTSKINTSRDSSGVVTSVVSAAGNVLSSFFGYKTAQVSATDPNRTAYVAPPAPAPAGMNPSTKNALMIGGGVLGAALLLVVATK